MKTITRFMVAYIVLSFSGVISMKSQADAPYQQSYRYSEISDSMSNDLSEKNQYAIEQKNQHVDSLIQQQNQTWENHQYMAQTRCQAHNDEIDTIMANLEREMNQLKVNANNALQTQQQTMNGLLQEKENQIKDTLKILDSLEIKYAEMLMNKEQYTDSSLNCLYQCLIQKNEQIDSMLQIKNIVCNQYRTKVDLCLKHEKHQIDSLLANKLEKADSVVGIQTKARFKIAEKQQHQFKLADVIEEIALMDSNKICINFNLKLRDTIKLKEQIKLQLKDSAFCLKSASAEEVKIDEITWETAKSDLVILTLSNDISDQYLIEILFDGEVNIINDKVTFSSLTSIITNVLDGVNLSVYPNPAENYISLKNIDNITSVEIFSLNGKNVFSSAYIGSSSIPVYNLSPDVYLIKAVDATGKLYTGKFIKK